MARLRAIFLLLIFFTAGCFGKQADTRLENVKTADSFSKHQIKNGLIVGIDPIISTERAKAIFGDIDILSEGIQPIRVVVSNKSSRAYFLDTLQIYLHNKKGEKKFPLSASELVDRLSGTQAVKKKKSLIGFITENPLTYKLGKRARFERDVKREVLQSMTINSGYQAEGLLFFSMNGDMESLSIPMFDMVEKKLIDFEIGVR